MPDRSRRELTVLILYATALGVIDSLLPKPLPFMRLGLANIASVIAVTRLGFVKALELNILRAASVALITGTLSTPTFLLSLCGAMASAGSMSFAHRLFRNWISIPGISVTGAVVSLWVQLLAASVILHDIPVGAVLPWITFWGVASGAFIGVVSVLVLEKGLIPGVLRRT